jgi:hypothetical protein
MLRDVFYFGNKPNVHPKEKFAKDLEDARNQSISEDFWIINEYCIYSNFDWDFDFDLLPDNEVWAKDHINIWPSLYQKDSGTWLCSKNKSDIKIYRNDVEPLKRKSTNNWLILDNIDIVKFDLNWHHDPTEPSFIYKWGCKFFPVEVKSVLEYHVEGAVNIKYMEDVVDLLPNKNWKIYHQINETLFDFTWRPDPREPAFIYTWGNKHVPAEVEPTLEYHVPGATERKYMGEVDVLPEYDRYKILIPVKDFDFTWRPDPREPAFIYVFGNKWNDSKTEPTVEYHVPGATERKYMDFPIANTTADMKNWSNYDLMNSNSFDFSWRPNPFSPPQIYQWINNGPCYVVPGATDVVMMKYEKSNKINRYEIKTTLEDLIQEHLDEVFWALNPDLNYEKFDFSWEPNEGNFKHINTFGNRYSKNTQTYYINGPMYKLGHREFNYVEDHKLNIETNLEIFYVDRYNVESQSRFEELNSKYPNIKKIRFFNNWVDTILRCANKSTTKLFYVIDSELDYSKFKFDFYPSPWQMNMVHIFGTQWSHWGTTFLINKETFVNDTKYIKIVEHLSNINFVKSKKAKATNCLHDIVLIDFGNNETLNISELLKNKTKKQIKILPYNNSYHETLIPYLKTLPEKKENYLWICSSICDYNNFDFSYICDPFAKDQLHVFPSDDQKYGDTFLIDVDKFKNTTMSKLNEYEKINFNQHQRVKRLPCPIIETGETHCDEKYFDFDFPYAVFKTFDNYQNKAKIENISLWDKDKTILCLSEGNTNVVVPKVAKKHLKKELYDYPFIITSDKLNQSEPMDIVFLSNGEKCADEHYDHLLKLGKSIPNKISRVDGIQGRVKSFHAGANNSSTPWFFMVFAKLKVNENFDFNWQPDRLQVPKHYVFYAKNPVNGLIYGHQSMALYNKNIVLNTEGKTLDFTMEGEHTVVELLSGVANFNTDEYSTWRTAFRECIKLSYQTDLESKERLFVWLNVAKGKYSDYSIKGSQDAVEYFEKVNGNFDDLKLTYEWNWLENYYKDKYK